MNPTSDDELRAQFEALRHEDLGRAPDFGDVLHRTRSPERHHRRQLDPLWIAAAAVIVLAAGIVVREGLQRSADRAAKSASLDEGATSISRWRSPTASLLRTSGSGVLAPPRILSSILDGASNAAVQH